MSASRDRAANRQSRRGSKTKNHEPLLRLVQSEEIRRKPVKPTTRDLKPLTDAQAQYDRSILTNTITFGLGPAGTGKTWWAAMRAAEALKDGLIERIIVTRPAVEAGETLGFLPGELDEKYEPYFRPVRDALEESFGTGQLDYLLKSGIIEARPLALLRGATFKNAWVILDEAQNTSRLQMKLFLTRIGENAKMIVNGDPSQCDLPKSSESGLEDAVRRLSPIRSVGVVRFATEDIVRSGLCREIVSAYSDPIIEPDHQRYNDSTDDQTGLMRILRVGT